MKLHVHVDAGNAYSPAPAPGKAVKVTGLDNGTPMLPRQPASSKKNTPLTSGAVRYYAKDIITLQMAYLAITVAYMAYMFQI